MKLVLATALLLALSACADDQTTPRAQLAPTVTVTSTETVTAPPSEAVTPTATAPAIEDPEPDVITTDFPEDVDTPKHGGRYYAVGLAAGETFLIVESVRAVEKYGYHAGVGDVACLDGAGAAYGIRNSTNVSYLLFADKRAAYRFTDAYAAAEDGTQMGVAEVRTYCLD